MITLSGMSVETSSSVPPKGAGFGIVKVSACDCLGRRFSELGKTVTVLASMRKVPTGELPAGLFSVTG